LRNCYLKERTAQDIDQRITKILKDLGDPEPPLRLEIVRERLKLNLAFYSTSDAGVLAETVHRLKVAGKQVLQRPWLLVEAVKRWELKALWVPDRKRILIDSELPSAKQRWGEAHEIGHSILPWHDAVMHGDRKQTMNLACELQLESEANFAAGRLLFLQDVFTEHVRASPLTFDMIKSLSKVFGNTMTSTLWRAVEACESPVFGLVSQHPRQTLGDEPLRYFVRSRAFEQQFGQITAMQIFTGLKEFCWGNRGPLGASEVVLADVYGEQHVFFVEVFFNSHDALTLGVYQRTRMPIVTV